MKKSMIVWKFIMVSRSLYGTSSGLASNFSWKKKNSEQTRMGQGRVNDEQY